MENLDLSSYQSSSKSVTIKDIKYTMTIYYESEANKTPILINIEYNNHSILIPNEIIDTFDEESELIFELYPESLEELEELLQESIEHERYEQAAEIQKEINKYKNQQ